MEAKKAHDALWREKYASLVVGHENAIAALFKVRNNVDIGVRNGPYQPATLHPTPPLTPSTPSHPALLSES